MNKRATSFIFDHVNQIRKGGLPVLFRKLLILLLVPVIIVIRILRPLILIRFGSLFSSRIGHFAADVELYLCRRDLSRNSKPTFDIFYYHRAICNQQLQKMWERIIHVSPIAYWLYQANRLIPGGEQHVVPSMSEKVPELEKKALELGEKHPARDRDALLERTSAHLSFTPEEERLGQAALRELGMANGAAFVCFHSRSPAYLERMFPNENWRYHDYRDSSVKSYIPAVEELTDRGYVTIRMGAIVKEPLQTTNPMIIDYATKSRTEFLDIFLGAKCHFCLSDASGFFAIPMVFRRPLAIVNMISLEGVPAWGSNYLFIPKKLWLRKERRFMGFREIIDSGAGLFFYSEDYEQSGIEVIDNTAQEIADLAVEMHERLKNRWQTTEEDEQLQRRFWALFKPTAYNKTFLARIGAEFLRQNRELLD